MEKNASVERTFYVIWERPNEYFPRQTTTSIVGPFIKEDAKKKAERLVNSSGGKATLLDAIGTYGRVTQKYSWE